MCSSEREGGGGGRSSFAGVQAQPSYVEESVRTVEIERC